MVAIVGRRSRVVSDESAMSKHDSPHENGHFTKTSSPSHLPAAASAEHKACIHWGSDRKHRIASIGLQAPVSAGARPHPMSKGPPVFRVSLRWMSHMRPQAV